ncbi:MAG: DUF4912 domain-containing protein [Treponema sp.]|jgi:hypothetical protein|nr:DUF4912 domain-containing protein [Treponema sp.]
MDVTRFTRVFLESLSTDELVKLADSHGIDIPPDLERIFIIEELLEIGSEEEWENEFGREGVLRGEADFLEPVPLPVRYNITYIEVMIRDPLWVFVFWEIKGHDREFFEKSPDFDSYCLRVCPLGAAADGDAGSFTVPVGISDAAWYLGFPPEGGRYRVELRTIWTQGETVLAVSRPFTLPKLISPQNQGVMEEVYRNPLSVLSGAGDFPVIRSTDRRSRTKNRDLGGGPGFSGQTIWKESR